MIFRSDPKPGLKWGRPALSVFVGLVLPAIPAAAFLWISNINMDDATGAVQAIWFVCAILMATPLFAWLALPIAVPLVWIMARYGFAGPANVVLLSLAVGLPLVHIVLNGDLTGEAPEMIPYIATALSIQALSGWFLLHALTLKAETAQTA